MEYSQQSLAIAKETKNQKLEGEALFSLGAASLRLGDKAHAIEYLQQSLAIAATPNSTWLAFAAGALLSGTGTGLINGEMSNVAMSIVPIERSGMASGINSTMRQVGVALGFAGLGAILAKVQLKMIAS